MTKSRPLANYLEKKKIRESLMKRKSRAKMVSVPRVLEGQSLTYLPRTAQEIATLRKEAQAFKSVRTALRTPSDDKISAAKLVFEKVRQRS